MSHGSGTAAQAGQKPSEDVPWLVIGVFHTLLGRGTGVLKTREPMPGRLLLDLLTAAT